MSEPAWNTKEKREKLMELVFEKFNAPGKDLYFEFLDRFIKCSDKDSSKRFMLLNHQYLLHLQMAVHLD